MDQFIKFSLNKNAKHLFEDAFDYFHKTQKEFDDINDLNLLPTKLKQIINDGYQKLFIISSHFNLLICKEPNNFKINCYQEILEIIDIGGAFVEAMNDLLQRILFIEKNKIEGQYYSKKINSQEIETFYNSHNTNRQETCLFEIKMILKQIALTHCIKLSKCKMIFDKTI